MAAFTSSSDFPCATSTLILPSARATLGSRQLRNPTEKISLRHVFHI